MTEEKLYRRVEADFTAADALRHGSAPDLSKSADRADVPETSANVQTDSKRQDLISPISPISHPSESWPKPIADEGFHGLAGEFVRLVEPHSEADPSALLTQFLVAAGNVIGRGPHFVAEADEHHLLVRCSGRTYRQGTQG